MYHGHYLVDKAIETLGDDIGLVTTTVPFNNALLSRNVLPTRRSVGIRVIQVLNNFSVMGHAPKTRSQDRRTWFHLNYIILGEGIYPTNVPFIPHSPQIREGMCGTSLLGIQNALDDNARPEAGEICGFFLRCNVKGYNGANLYAYAQSVDCLIDNWWEIVPSETVPSDS